MNKDVDLRLVPPGEYRDAANIQIATSEGADVGAIESILGNLEQNAHPVSGSWQAKFGGLNTKVIGSTRDTQNNKIYWFITCPDNHIDAIVEYNIADSKVTPIIIDARTSNAVLNFNASNIITGINIIDGLLFWTDDLNEPRVINIADFKSATATIVGAATTFADKTTAIYGRNFLASDITVIKQNPKHALSITTLSTTTGVVNGAGIYPATVRADFTDANNIRLVAGDTIGIEFDRNEELAPLSAFEGSEVSFKLLEDQTDGTEKEYEVIGTLSNVLGINITTPEGDTLTVASNATLTISTVSRDVPSGIYDWKMTLVEDEPIFKNDFPRFSYRWKYQDGQYSGYAPFSKAAFIADQYKYKAEDGYNLGMDSNIRKITLTFTNTGIYALPADVVEIDILYKGVGSNNIYVLETHKVSSGALNTFDITNDLLGPVIQENQLLRLYDNVPRAAKAQEIIGNRIVYGNYLQNYNLTTAPNLTCQLSSVNFTASEKYYGKESVKSDRSYQIGIAFLDDFGRESPVFTSKSGNLKIDLTKASKKNTLQAKCSVAAPSWASYYKYYVKDASNQHYNIALDRTYEAEDGNIWFSFPSADRNKVSEGDFLLQKKQHGTSSPVTSSNRYKILDIQNEAPDFIKRTNKAIHRVAIEITTPNTDFIGKILTFTGPNAELYPFLASALQGENTVRFQSNDGEINSFSYKITSGGADLAVHGSTKNLYEIELADDTLKEDDSWLYTGAGSIDVFIIVEDKSTELLPEFQGKFFAKVPRRASFERDVIESSLNDVEAHPLYHATDIVAARSTLDRNLTSSLSYGVTANGLTGHASNGFTSSADTVFAMHLFEDWIGDEDPPERYFVEQNHPTRKLFNNIKEGEQIRFGKDGNFSTVYNITDVVSSSYSTTVAGTPETTYSFSKKVVTINRVYSAADRTLTGDEPNTIQIVRTSLPSTVASPEAAIFETQPIESAELDIYYEASEIFDIDDLDSYKNLQFKNCFSFGNGVESNRIRDDFNAPLLGKGVRVNTTLQQPYQEQRKSSGLIYSGLINSDTEFNESNQFIAAEKITKDLNPIYGSIQKLSARGAGARGDLLVLCEDKVFKVLANKDALFNADGNANLTASTNVLGQAIPFAGEYGISQNPESFASYGFRAYFADKARRAVLRLSADGLTVISDKGMRNYFSDKWDAFGDNKIYGSFDERNEVYNVTTSLTEQVSFNEAANGWPTRLTYVSEFSGLSLDNQYYTFYEGKIWKHNSANRNNFYESANSSSVEIIFNDAADKVKRFTALSYDGGSDWDAEVTTTGQIGVVTEWKNKEGLYYNFIKGSSITTTQDFSVQGIGKPSEAGTGVSTITFAKPINVSVQVGDGVYKNAISSEQGVITTISSDRLEFTIGSSMDVATSDFIYVKKPVGTFVSALTGNVAKVEMTKAGGLGATNELFSVSAEAFISSE